MKKLLIYLKDYKIESVLAPLFKMLEALFELFVPIVMAKVIDIGIPAGDRSYVIRMCLVMILLGIIGLVCSITASISRQKPPVVLPRSSGTLFLSTYSLFRSRKWTPSEPRLLSQG